VAIRTTPTHSTPEDSPVIDNTCCPSCNNDIADLVLSVANERETGTDDDQHTRVCPHCNTELAIAVAIRAQISRADGGPAGQY
jgi:hypothetical protein